MNDTPPSVEEQYRALLMARAPEERFRMAVGMFDLARTMVLASLPPGLPIEEVRRRLFERIYADLPESERPPELARP